MTNGPVRDSALNGSGDWGLAELVDELTARLQAGGRVDLDAVIREHPDHASALRELFPALAGLDGLSRSGEAATTGDVAGTPDPASGALGDFRILHELGRGGMGVVYEAEQISLNRRVALKVLPFAATMDPRHLQRFKNEAQAAAHLHHTNIVPVYFVGCERGVHFYAMQLIEGRSLAEVIGELRHGAGPADRSGDQPTGPYAPTPAAGSAPTRPAAALSTERSARGAEFFRSAARLGVQAAEALEHAHQLGIVHRDVKPANLMVDARGNLWVTDFGLAQVQTDARLTATGDLLGTLRYMSPEQALAQRVVVDHRTDVYSLGATLYELLTLEPAFAGADRQEVLREIAFEEPRPLRKLDRRVPAELETVVLKAMAKDPNARYATAQELADDLQRWLEHKPVRARRPTLTQRAAKLARRHRGVAWTAAVGLLLAAAVLGGSVSLAVQAALERRGRTDRLIDEALAEAERLQGEGRWPEALAAARRAEGVLDGGEASPGHASRARQARAELELIHRLEEALLLRYQGVKDGNFDEERGYREYLRALRDYGIDVEVMDPEEAATRIPQVVRVQVAATLYWWVLRTGHAGQDGKLRERALAVACAANPEEREWRERLGAAATRRDRAAVLAMARDDTVDDLPLTSACLLAVILERLGEAERAVAVLTRAQRRSPGDFLVNLTLAQHLGRLQPPQWGETLRFHTAMLSLRPNSPGAHLNVGSDLAQLGRDDEAVAEFREAIRLKPDYPEAHNHLGHVLYRRGRLAEAITAFREAIRLKPDFELPHSNLGAALAEMGRPDEAIAACREAIRLKPDFADAHSNLGAVLNGQGRHREAEVACREAVRLEPDDAGAHSNLGRALTGKGQWDGAVAALREAIRLKPDFAEAHSNLGDALAKKGRPDEAVAAYREAIRLKSDLHKTHSNLGNALAEMGRLDEAIAEHREAIRLRPDEAWVHSNLGNALAKKGRPHEAVAALREAIRLKPDFAEAHHNLGLTLAQMDCLDEAIAAFRSAIRIKPGFAEAHLGLGVTLQRQGEFQTALGELRRGHELGSKMLGWRLLSAQAVANCERLVELESRLPIILGGKEEPGNVAEAVAFAEVCSVKRLHAGAARLYRDALRAQPKIADNPGNNVRYNAACAAALAGCGQGEDVAGLEAEEFAHLRSQALAWLRADLAAWRKILDAEPVKSPPAVTGTMKHWLADPDFAGVRGAEALARRPEPERADWEQLWREVDELRRRAEAQPKPEAPQRP